jgi:hypothetical protein
VLIYTEGALTNGRNGKDYKLNLKDPTSYPVLKGLTGFVANVLQEKETNRTPSHLRVNYSQIFDSFIFDIDWKGPAPLETVLLECNGTIHADTEEKLQELFYKISTNNFTQGLYLGRDAFLPHPSVWVFHNINWDSPNIIYNRFQTIISSGIFNYFLQDYNQGQTNRTIFETSRNSEKRTRVFVI